MSLQVEKLEKNMAKLTIEASAEEFEAAIEKAYQKNKSKMNIQGFRKGKAPRKIIEKMYGAGVFYEEAANVIIPDAYAKAVDECDLEIVSQPSVDVVQVEAGKPFIFTAEVAVKPEVKLGDYKGIEVEKTDVEVSDEDVNAEIDRVREQNARTITVEDRAVQDKDTAVIDFEGFKDGVAFEGGKGENYSLTIGSNTFIPGFEDALIGREAGEEVAVNVTFPEDYHAENLKGAPVTFKVKINTVKEKNVPELDEDFFADLGMEGINSKETLEKQVEENIKTRKEYDNENKYVDALLDKAVENMEVEVPEEMIYDETDRMINRYEQTLSMQGIKLDDFYKMTNSTEEDLREKMHDEALKIVKQRLLLEAIVKEESLNVSDEEAEHEAEHLAGHYNMTKEDFLKEFGGLEMVKYDTLVKKAIEILKEND